MSPITGRGTGSTDIGDGQGGCGNSVPRSELNPERNSDAPESVNWGIDDANRCTGR
jgi:hypothetical protein